MASCSSRRGRPPRTDWVCEILSPSNTRLDRVHKMPAYARSGVSHAWLVDPLAQTLEVFRLECGRWVTMSTHAGDDPVRAEPFEALAFPAARRWADVEPEAASPSS